MIYGIKNLMDDFNDNQIINYISLDRNGVMMIKRDYEFLYL
jgi:hypothetical protein